MTAISVTVDGPPVTASITLEQVRAYLRSKGWELEYSSDSYERWTSVS